MSSKTNCDKCIFADYSTSEEPCAMGIIDQISNIKTMEVTEAGFNSILHYRCPFAFSTEVYQQHKADIGSISDLRNQLISRAAIAYYMVITLKEKDIEDTIHSITELAVKPKFISFLVEKSDNTEYLIKLLNNLTSTTQWKLHNILEDNPTQQDILDIALSTNTNTNTSQYLWINKAESRDSWNKNICDINKTIVIEQPMLHAMFRTQQEDGLFIGMHNYQQLIKDKKTDIISAIKSLPNPLIYYYA